MTAFAVGVGVGALIGVCAGIGIVLLFASIVEAWWPDEEPEACRSAS